MNSFPFKSGACLTAALFSSLLGSAIAGAQPAQSPQNQSGEASQWLVPVDKPSQVGSHIAIDGAMPPVVGERSPVVWTPPANAAALTDEDAPRVDSGDLSARLHDRLHYDVQEGTQWVLGEDYKASAGANGFTFMPFLGSDAPKTYGMRMTLGAATMGGKPVPLDKKASVKRIGDQFRLDRGPIDVTYDLSLGFVEQSFVLEFEGAAAELVLEIDVDTELMYERRGSDVFYVNERGGVTYSHAIVIDGAGKRLDIEIEASQDSIRLVVPASFMAIAVAPIIVDPIVQAYQVNPGTSIDLHHPDVAYDQGTNAFAYVHESAWSISDTDVWLATYDGNSGAFLALASFDFTTDDVLEPSIASDNTSDQYLIVARNKPIGEVYYEVIGRTIDATDVSLQSPSVVLGGTFGSPGGGTAWTNYRPSVAGKSQGTPKFHLVWARQFYGASDFRAIRALSITPVVPHSTVTAPSFGGFVSVSGDPLYRDSRPTISESSGMSSVAEWRIAFVRERISDSMQSILTSRVADDGTVISAATPLANISSGAWLSTLDVSDGLDSISGPAGTHAVYLLAVKFTIGAADETIYLYGVEGDSLFGGRALKSMEPSAPLSRKAQPRVATLASRFTVAYMENVSGSVMRTCYSTSVDLTNTFEWAVNDRRTVVKQLTGGFDFRAPGMSSRFSGGLYASRYVGVGVGYYDQGAAKWNQWAGVVFPSQGPAPARQYCVGTENSTGDYGFLTMDGTASVSTTKTLMASAMPSFQFGYFLASQGGEGQIVPPGSAGLFCLAGAPLGRYNGGIEVFFTGTGSTAQLDIDPMALRGPNGNQVALPGQTWNFQAWHRENGGSSNFTNAVSLNFD